jgi:hypothetical protein
LKPRFAVDLDEVERPLARGPSAPASPAQTTRNDPLAELARIVGQDDPFQSLLAGDKARPRHDPHGLDDLFVPQRGPDGSGAVAPDVLRGPLDTDGRAAFGQETFTPQADHGYHPHHAQQWEDEAAYAQETHIPDYYRDDPNAVDPASLEEGNDFYEAPKPKRRRKSLIAVGAMLGLAAVGVGGVLVMNGGGVGMMLSGGEPPLIKATNEPTKVQPQSPGGLEIPNQNKQIYERAGQEAQTKVVNREEQPVDVRQAVRAAAAPNMDMTGASASSPTGLQPATGGLNLGEPRRVRTISIRPDGTIIGAEGSAPPAVPVPAPAPAVAPQPAQPALASAAAGAQPAPMALAPATAPAQSRPAATTPTASMPRPAIPTAATPSGGSSPQAPAATAASPPAPQRLASAQPIPVAPAAAPAVDTGMTGGFAVQLGFSPSEGDARAMFQRLQQKYADLANLPPIIRQAEVNGNTIYRVRVGPMGREEASTLCSKIQGQGGQCFVAKN